MALGGLHGLTMPQRAAGSRMTLVRKASSDLRFVCLGTAGAIAGSSKDLELQWACSDTALTAIAPKITVQ